MRKLIPILALALIVGCVTPSRTIYNTLASVQVTTAGAYNAYLDLVVQGKVATNSVPTISRDYTSFLAVWTSAVTVAAAGVNSPATAPVTEASAKVIADITVAKGTQ